MVAAHDRLTDEWQRSCIRLNDELIFSPQKYGQEDFFHIEIPSAAKFYRIGYHEYVFISLLDGDTSFAHALALTAQKLGAHAISETQARQTIHWLLENGMANFVNADYTPDARAAEKRKSNWLQKLNPFWIKIPLGNPDRFLDSLLPYCRWAFQPISIVLTTILILAGVWTALNQWEPFTSSLQLFSQHSWIWMLASWVFLKTIHEMAHGLVCRYYGGKVRETGIIFILLAPLAYVDVTSSWKFASRWRRIAVACAGMYIELVVAAICMFAWSMTTSDVIRQMLAHLIVMASLTTLLFNANPLMRFDGYFVLSDLLKIPNLYTAGSTSFQNHLKWIFYGQHAESSCCEIKNHPTIVGLYGWLAAGWKVLICFGLAIAASVMFKGLGILLATFGIFSWIARPVKSVVRDWRIRKQSRPSSVVRSGIVATCLIGLMLSSWYLIPNPFSSRSPCLVDFDDSSKVRAESSGFVKEVYVSNGQFVKQGEILLKLDNPDLATRVRELNSDLNRYKTLERIALDEHKPADAQVAVEHRRAIEKNLLEKQNELDRLLVQAPKSGYIVSRRVEQKTGEHVQLGDVLMMIGNGEQKEIVLSISPQDIGRPSDLVGKTIPIEIGSRRRVSATIKRIDPRASSQITHPSLIAPHGGPLALNQAMFICLEKQKSRNLRVSLGV